MDNDRSAPQDAATNRARSKRWRLALVLTGIGVVVIVLSRPDPEPTHGDRSISTYFPDLILPHSNSNYVAATNALLSVGADALPIVLNRVQKKVPWHIKLYLNQRTNVPTAVQRFVKKYVDPWFYQHRYHGAIRAVGVLGTNAAPIASELVKELPHTRFSQRSIFAEGLARIGPPVIDPIKPLLTSPDLKTRNLAAFICYRLGRSAIGVAPELVAGLNDSDLNHQRLVGQTLARMGNKVAPTIFELLTTDNPVLIRVGLSGAAGILIQPSELVEKIARLLYHPDAEIRREAAFLLLQRWPRNPTAIENALRARSENNERVEDYLRGIEIVQSHQDQLLIVLHEGVRQPDVDIKVKSLAKLVHLDPDQQKIKEWVDDLNNLPLSNPQRIRAQNLSESINAIRE